MFGNYTYFSFINMLLKMYFFRNPVRQSIQVRYWMNLIQNSLTTKMLELNFANVGIAILTYELSISSSEEN